MDKWDGQAFIDKMNLDKDKSVLEIGVGTGRLAVRIAPLCGQFYGIDISTKTIDRAKENLSEQTKVKLLCEDFQTLDISYSFDVIYSSLTFMHIEEKQIAINKVAALQFHGASVGHFRNGPYDLNDIVCDLTDSEERKEEIIEAIKEVNFGKMPQRFMGKELQ